MPLLPLLQQAQIEPFDKSFSLSHWQDAAATEDIGSVPSGYKYVVTGVIVQNLGAASVLDFYDETSGNVAEANHLFSVDAKGTDTTVVTGLNVPVETALSVTASVCANAHDLKITVFGVQVEV